MNRARRSGMVLMALMAGLVLGSDATDAPPRVWYLTNFYAHYRSQDLGAIEAACRQRNIDFINDRTRLYKYLPQYGADHGNATRLSDDGYQGVILAIPEQQDTNSLTRLREFVEAGGHVVVLFNAVSGSMPKSVGAFSEIFDVVFVPRLLVRQSGMPRVGIDGGTICPLWGGLKVGFRSWRRCGIDAYLISNAGDWIRHRFVIADDGNKYCVSATRRLGAGTILFQATPTDGAFEPPSSARLHHTSEVYFPNHLDDFDNLEAFLRLVEFAAAGTAAPTELDLLPFHEAAHPIRFLLRNGEPFEGRVARWDETGMRIVVSQGAREVAQRDVASVQGDLPGEMMRLPPLAVSRVEDSP